MFTFIKEKTLSFIDTVTTLASELFSTVVENTPAPIKSALKDAAEFTGAVFAIALIPLAALAGLVRFLVAIPVSFIVAGVIGTCRWISSYGDKNGGMVERFIFRSTVWVRAIRIYIRRWAKANEEQIKGKVKAFDVFATLVVVAAVVGLHVPFYAPVLITVVLITMLNNWLFGEKAFAI